MSRRERKSARTAATGAAAGRLPRAQGGSSGRAAAGALRLANSIGAAISNRRVLGRAEAGPLLAAAIALFVAAALAVLWPRLIAWPLALLGLWIGASLVARYVGVRKQKD